MPTKAKHKGRKVGRNIKKCQVYLITGRREINKERKAIRHLRKHPNDLQAMRRDPYGKPAPQDLRLS